MSSTKQLEAEIRDFIATKNARPKSVRAVARKAAIDELTKAVRTAQRQWTGLDWATNLTTRDAEEMDMTKEELRAAQAKERKEARDDANEAKKLGNVAIRAAKAGDWKGAISALHDAARIEHQYGDAPTWGPCEGLADRLSRTA